MEQNPTRSFAASGTRIIFVGEKSQNIQPRSGQGFLPFGRWRMKQGGGMRVADQRLFSFHFLLNPNMEYYQNYMADTVIRVDGNRRFAKSIDHIEECDVSNVPKEVKSIWGGESYGIFYVLTPISKQEYDTFGKTWTFGKSATEKVSL